MNGDENPLKIAVTMPGALFIGGVILPLSLAAACGGDVGAASPSQHDAGVSDSSTAADSQVGDSGAPADSQVGDSGAVADSAANNVARLWWTTFPQWVGQATQEAGTCNWFWGLEDFYSLPSNGPAWPESRASLGALLASDGVLANANHQSEVPAFLEGWKSLHDTEGKHTGFESGFFADAQNKQWVFDATSEFSPGVPWYAPIEMLKQYGMSDDMIFFIDTFDVLSGLGIDPLSLTPDAYAGPLADEVKAVREHAPTAFVAIHMILPYVEDGTGSPQVLAAEMAWIAAFASAASSRGTTIDALLFDSLRDNPQQDAGAPTTLDVSGAGGLLDATHAAGFKTGVFITSYQDPNGTPPACGFPRSGEDYEQSALAGIAALEQAGLGGKVDFYDLSSWTYWPRQAVPQDQSGTFCHALCAVEKALSFDCDAW
jgi:hypothetical protein